MTRAGAALLGASLFASAAVLGSVGLAQPAPPTPIAAVHNDLDVSFVPATGLLRVTARVTLPAGTKPELLLNAALKVTKSSPR